MEVPADPRSLLSPEVRSLLAAQQEPAARREGARQRAAELRARIAACEREQQRIRAEYEVEVRHCADLRESLEAREKELSSARAPLRMRLLEAKEALESADRAESAAMMRIEDDLARCGRLIEGKDREIGELERRLEGMQATYQTFLREGPPKDTAVEEELRAADKEMTELLAGVQRREELIASLNGDLRSALEYMISSNVEAAGGPMPELGCEDFLPSSVREHLSLSEHGAGHLAILYRKYEIMMGELRARPVKGSSEVSTASTRMHRRASDASSGVGHLNWYGSDDSNSEPQRAITPLEAGLEEVGPPAFSESVNAAGEALAQMMPAFTDIWSSPEEEGAELPVAPLVAASLEEDEDVWAVLAEEDGAVARQAPAAEEVAASASLEEEGRRLRESMAVELRQLAAALAQAEVDENQRASRELRRAAAQGDERAVRGLLARSAGDSSTIYLGWTAWHVAAAYDKTNVLEALKEDMCSTATHHLACLDKRTRMGLPPLGVALLTGRVEAAKSLLKGMAPLEARDSRGNSALLWAVIGGQARALVPLLLDAQADPEACNFSGQRPDITGLMAGCSMATLTRPEDKVQTVQEAKRAAPQPLPQPNSLGEAYHCIRARSAEPAEEPGLISYTLGMLKAPVRDALAFSHNEKALQHAQLSAAEADAGVWSEAAVNYTHAGLSNAVEVGRQNADPLLPHRNQQALVLTCERLLLFTARNWALAQVVALSEVAEVTTCSFSSSLLILRMQRLPDIVLDLAVAVRGRFLDELHLAVGTVAAQWGGADFGGGLRIRQESEPVIALLDERRRSAGTLAYVEPHVFLLLAYAPKSLLLAGGDTFFFGLLDVHQSGRGAWRWQTCFFILKSGPGEQRALLWCQHPNDERCLGSVPLRRLLAVQPLDTPSGEACLIVDYAQEQQQRQALTLRAASAQNREDWIVSLRTMQTGL